MEFSIFLVFKIFKITPFINNHHLVTSIPKVKIWLTNIKVFIHHH